MNLLINSEKYGIVSTAHSSFALRLKLYREMCHLTQQQVADILNINRTTYTKYETGVSEPSHEVLRKLVAIFGVDFNALFDTNFDILLQDPEKGEGLVKKSSAPLKLSSLADDEQRLLIAYRAMSDQNKQRILNDAVEVSGRINMKKLMQEELKKQNKAENSEENFDN